MSPERPKFFRFSLIFFLSLLLLFAHSSYAQYQITRVHGSLCSGAEAGFIIAASSCSYVNWSVSGGQIVYQDGTYVRVKWTSTSAQISCSYNCDYQSGYSYSPYYTISSPATPAVSISANKNNVCTGTSITFTASPTNGGTSPYYNWRVNGATAPGSTNSRYYTTSSLTNNDVVTCVMSTSLECYTQYSATSSPLVMTITQKQAMSVTVYGPTTLCNGATGNFYAYVVNSTGTLTYQWFKNGNIVGTNSPNFSTSALINGDNLSCRVTSNDPCVQSPVTSANFTVTVTGIQTFSAGINPGEINICSGSNVTLTATSSHPASGYQWQMNGSNVSGQTSSTFTTSASTDTQLKSIRVVVTTSAGCVNQTTATGTAQYIPFTIKPLPNATITGPASGCGSVNMQASTGTGYSWAWKNSSGTTVGTASNYTATASGTYHVITTLNNCSRTSASKSVTVNAVPTNPVSMTNGIRCGSGTVTISGSPGSNGNTLRWYSANTGGTTLYTGNSYSPNVSGTTTYYASTYNTTTGCESTSTRPGATATVNPLPTAYSLTGGGNYCQGGTGVTIGLNDTQTNVSYQLKRGTTNVGSAVAGTNNAISFGTHSTVGTYSVVATNNTTSCASNMANTTAVALHPTVAAPTTTGGNRCGPGSITLSGTPGTNGNTLKWYGASSGGTALSTGTSYPTPHILNTTTYYISSYNSSTTCESQTARVAATATIKSLPTVTAGANKYFFRGNSSSPLGGTPSGGTWTGSGVSSNSFVPSSVSAGTYTLTYSYTDGNSCTNTAQLSSTVYNNPTSVNNGSGSLPRGGTTELQVNSTYDGYQWYLDSVSIPGATARTILASKAGNYKALVTKNTASIYTPIINLKYYNLSEQASNMNFIIAHTIQKNGILEESDIEGLSIENIIEQIQYFDGLGRPIQTVTTQGSPLKKDMVQPVAYDNFGRQAVQYLPYRDNSNTGLYKTNAINQDAYTTSAQYQFYQPGGLIASDSTPYSETIFEPSPLNRPEKDFGPGSAWHTNDKHIRHQYLVNVHGTSTGQEKIIAWKINSSNMPVRPTVALAGYIVTPGGYYATGQLQVKSTRDEQGNEVREYTDKLGQVVLKKVQAVPTNTPISLSNRDHWSQTYYLYDDFGNLRFVLPPELSKAIHLNDTYNPTTTDLTNWAFQYKYDGRKRMTEKKVPGAGWVFMVYDKRDRLVMTQDGNQRSATTKYWSFTKYDALNRPVMTGITSNSYSTQASMQSAVDSYYSTMTSAKEWFEVYDGTTTIHGYSNKSYPQETNKNNYLTVSYYDNYGFKNSLVTEYNYLANQIETLTVDGNTYSLPAILTSVKGQITGTKVKVLDLPGTHTGGTSWLNTVSYYDKKYRVIQMVADNYKGGIDRVTTLYDFVGKPLKTKSEHYDLTWRNLVGIQRAGSNLRRTDPNLNWGGSGAASVEMLPANQDGWMEFTATATNMNYMVGLGTSNPDANWVSMNYAFYAKNNGYVEIRESGSGNVGGSVTYVAGDVFRIERIGGQIKYYKNSTPIRTQPAVNNALLVDMSLHTNTSIVGNVRSSFGKHSSDVVVRRYEYDHAGRLINTWHKLNSENEILLANNGYNELGQLVDKKLHSTVASATNAKQSVDYRYNIRGWLSRVNNADVSALASADNDVVKDFFGFELAYNTDLGTGNTPNLQYNGNISAMKWSNMLSIGSIKENAYNYTYDPLNRLKTATFKEKTTTWTSTANNALAESGLNYDLNGNISSLTRNDRRTTGWMDNLAYTYTGNQLMRVTDTGDDYAGFNDGQPGTGNDYKYDPNGNMTHDLNKGIGTSLTDATNLIKYNYLNLPETVTKGNNSIRYIYDATGRKLSQITTFGGQAKQVDYAGEFQYENDVLQFLSHEEGRIVVANNQTIFISDGSSLNNLTASTSTLALVTQNSNQKYVRATANGTTAKQGIFPIGGSIPVQPGEQYRIRAKGYRTGANAVHLYIRTNSTDLNWPGAQLANGLASESYTEQVITIPAGHTTLQAGVIWNTVTAGQQFFINDFEIVKLTVNEDPEYQYYLKDHLGNTRVTFTTVDHSETKKATLENATVAQDRANFLRYDNAKRINSAIFDRTNGASTGYSQRLAGGGPTSNERYGMAKSIAVMPGDVVTIDVYAKYVDRTQTSQWSAVLTTLMGQIMSGSTGVVTEGAAYTSSNSSFPVGYKVNTSGSTGTGPKIFLSHMTFDKNYVPVTDPSQTNFVRITTAAREDSTNTAHEKMTATVTVKQAGYMYIYYSNEESTTNYEAFFDDFTVTHTKSPVIQAEDYYPFGLVASSYRRENSLEQNYLYNGKELQDELNLGWMDYGARMYMADIGRWGVVDPSAENYLSHSMYSYVLNNPLNLIDPDGRDARVSSSTDSSGNVTTTIQSTIYITGDGASEKRAEKLNQAANNILKSQTVENEDGTTTTVQFDVNYVYVESSKDAKIEAGDNLLIGLSNSTASTTGILFSQVESSTRITGNSQIQSAGTKGYMVGGFSSNTTVHESLHFLGLSDRYTESSITINGVKERTTSPNPGFENDIMGTSGSKNISSTHYKNYVNYFNGKGNHILKTRIDKDAQGNLKQ